jgi:hypothetical protein
MTLSFVSRNRGGCPVILSPTTGNRDVRSMVLSPASRNRGVLVELLSVPLRNRGAGRRNGFDGVLDVVVGAVMAGRREGLEKVEGI